MNTYNLTSLDKHLGLLIGPLLLILLRRMLVQLWIEFPFFSGTAVAVGGDDDAAGGWMCNSISSLKLHGWTRAERQVTHDGA